MLQIQEVAKRSDSGAAVLLKPNGFFCMQKKGGGENSADDFSRWKICLISNKD